MRKNKTPVVGDIIIVVFFSLLFAILLSCCTPARKTTGDTPDYKIYQSM